MLRPGLALGLPLLAQLSCGADGTGPGIDRRAPNPTCRAPGTASVAPPARLGETGCFDPRDPTRPLPALIPYAVNAPLWSDGADKERWLALPDDTRLQVNAGGDLALPPGAVLIKTFRLGGRRVETRFFVRSLDGTWAGYTYAWHADGADATLLDEGSHRRDIGGQEWHFPSRAECNRCHTAAAGFSLGLELAQLDRSFDYPGGRRANQLATFTHLGLFEAPVASRAPLPSPDDASASLEARARAYLHANCAGCHRPEVGNAGSVDLRFATPLAETGACDAEPRKGTLGLGPEVRLVAPGKPEASMVALRMRALDSARMPTIASLTIDEVGTSLVEAWIRSLAACP